MFYLQYLSDITDQETLQSTDIGKLYHEYQNIFNDEDSNKLNKFFTEIQNGNFFGYFDKFKNFERNRDHSKRYFTKIQDIQSKINNTNSSNNLSVSNKKQLDSHKNLLRVSRLRLRNHIKDTSESFSILLEPISALVSDLRKFPEFDSAVKQLQKWMNALTLWPPMRSEIQTYLESGEISHKSTPSIDNINGEPRVGHIPTDDSKFISLSPWLTPTTGGLLAFPDSINSVNPFIKISRSTDEFLGDGTPAR